MLPADVVFNMCHQLWICETTALMTEHSCDDSAGAKDLTARHIVARALFCKVCSFILRGNLLSRYLR